MLVGILVILIIVTAIVVVTRQKDFVIEDVPKVTVTSPALK